MDGVHQGRHMIFDPEYVCRVELFMGQLGARAQGFDIADDSDGDEDEQRDAAVEQPALQTTVAPLSSFELGADAAEPATEPAPEEAATEKSEADRPEEEAATEKPEADKPEKEAEAEGDAAGEEAIEVAAEEDDHEEAKPTEVYNYHLHEHVHSGKIQTSHSGFIEQHIVQQDEDEDKDEDADPGVAGGDEGYDENYEANGDAGLYILDSGHEIQEEKEEEKEEEDQEQDDEQSSDSKTASEFST